MKPAVVILWLALALTLCHCTRRAEIPTDGIEVGNALIQTLYSQYRFQLDYPSTFQLREKSLEHFALKNPGEGQIAFQIYKNGRLDDGRKIKNLVDLKDYLQLTAFREKTWSKTEVQRLAGYCSPEGSQSTSLCYLLSPSGDVVQIKNTLGENRIISSIRYDDKPPILHTLGVASSTLKQTDILSLQWSATDDVSGIGERAQGILSSVGHKGKEFPFTVSSYLMFGEHYQTMLELDPTSIDVGNYILKNFSICDRVSNCQTLQAPTNGDSKYYRNTRIPLVRFSVSPNNELTKTEPPIIRRLENLKAITEAGGQGALLIEAQDNGSGIRDFINLWGQLFPLNFDAPKTFRVFVSGILAPNETRGQYALIFRVGRYVPNGVYYLRHFRLRDNISNMAALNTGFLHGGDSTQGHFYESNIPGVNLPVVSVRIRNTENDGDTEPPMVEALSLANEQLSPGDQARLLIKASDNLSGIDPLLFPSSTFAKLRGIPGASELKIVGAMKLEKSGEYSLDFDIPEEMPAGTYYLRRFVAGDLAQNRRHLVAAPPKNLKDLNESFYEGAGDVKIQVVKFTVTARAGKPKKQ